MVEHTFKILALWKQRLVDLSVQGQPSLQNKLWNSKDYTDRPVFKKK